MIPNCGGFYNDIDHSGYKMNELYTNTKYSTFKQEISNYNCLNIDQYHDEILPKATSYLNTNYVKLTKAKGGNICGIPQHYDIPSDSSITLSHIISVILYCDYTQLSSNFSNTFRKKGPWDTLENIKHRNREYFWMSKLLRETVEIFGECSSDGLNGPFYSGLSAVINIPNFFIRLYSPTSTSVQIQVATKFSGDNGMIMKLNNPQGSVQCMFLRGFNCSFISRFKEEDERYDISVCFWCI